MLRPSQRIDKDFAQVDLITDEGKRYTGIRVEENDKEIVLRNLAQPAPMVFSKEEIERIKDSRTSLMPANLARMLKSRQEFNDLLKYVIEVRKR